MRSSKRWGCTLSHEGPFVRQVCPRHGLTLECEIVDVRTGLFQVLRKKMVLGKCPKKLCGFTVEFCLDYSMVIRESSGVD
jgi:hypothetical protein